MAPQVGLEPTTLRLTAECSAIELLRIKIRQRPNLPGRVQPSTFGAKRLNFCVRNGNRWNPLAITTGKGMHFYFPHLENRTFSFLAIRSAFSSFNQSRFFGLSLNRLFSDQALDRLVSSSSIHYCTSTDDLSPHRL